MGLVEIEATADVLQSLHDVEGLYLVVPTVEDLGADQYRVSGFLPEALIPQVEALGCQVRVLMTTQEIDGFHSEVEGSVTPAPEPEA